jgi:hypothetical protein
VYAVTDIEAFIANVLSAIPGAGKSPITPMVLEIDRSRHWRINKFDQTGMPMAMLQPNADRARDAANVKA